MAKTRNPGHERGARQRQKALELALKEQAKLSALEAARLEVDAFENALELLSSIHKEQSTAIDWSEYASVLPPHPPIRLVRHELHALFSGGHLDAALARDEHDHRDALAHHARELIELKRLQGLARRILEGDTSAYLEAIAEISPIAELSALGSSVRTRTCGPQLIACDLRVKGQGTIPAQVKSLTTTGKVSTKAMPKARFHEIYQDYVCGCVLRLAREMFGLLPVRTVLVTAMVEVTAPQADAETEIPVLSVAMPREVLARLDFERIDPSDAMELFLHRGDAKAARRSGDFVAITPLVPSDLADGAAGSADLATLVTDVQRARAVLRRGPDREAQAS
jgi:hypothetical protein